MGRLTSAQARKFGRWHVYDPRTCTKDMRLDALGSQLPDATLSGMSGMLLPTDARWAINDAPRLANAMLGKIEVYVR